MSEWKDISLGVFQEKLASKDPTPGGGSASAVALGQAAALTNMVVELTLGRDKWEDGWLAAENAKSVATNILGDYSFDLAKRDSDAFESVMGAFRMPRDSEEEVSKRKRKIIEATWEATLVPLETAKSALQLLSKLPELAKKGNANAVTDVGVASLLASAACKGALFNVEINLGSLPSDDEKVASVKNEVEEIRIASSDYSRDCIKSVRERI